MLNRYQVDRAGGVLAALREEEGSTHLRPFISLRSQGIEFPPVTEVFCRKCRGPRAVTDKVNYGCMVLDCGHVAILSAACAPLA